MTFDAGSVDEEIQELIQTYQRGLNEGDLDVIRSVYADDAMFIGQPYPTTTGIEKIIDTYAATLEAMDFDVKFDIQEVELSGDLGYVRTQSHGTITQKGQTPEGSEGNREIFIVWKIDGRWKFWRYMFNAEVK